MVLETNDLIIIGSAVMFPNIGAILGGSILEAFCRIDPWIQSLIKPAYSPPTWVLPPLWIVIFCSIGLASYLVYKEATLSAERWDWGVQLPLMLYIGHVLLIWLWTPITFAFHSLKMVGLFWLCDRVYNFISKLKWSFVIFPCDTEYNL